MGNGAFDDLTSYRASSIRDGLSQTIFVGETARLLNDPDPQFNQWSRPGYFQVSPTFDPTGLTFRPQGFAFQVPRINAPDDMQGDYAGGFGIGSNPSSPGPNPPAAGHPLARHVRLQGVDPLNIPGSTRNTASGASAASTPAAPTSCSATARSSSSRSRST